jgi:hypothetical protein
MYRRKKKLKINLKMPPTYLFGLPHAHDKSVSVLGISDSVLKFLRLTSLGFICSGLYLLSVSSHLYYNQQSTNVRGSLDDDMVFYKQRHTHLEIESISNIGMWSVAVGICSTFNYIFYTGIPNIFSAIDFFCVIASGFNFVYQNHVLITAGHQTLLLMHIWCILTLLLYVYRRKPSDQIWVHLSGQCGIILWYVLLHTKTIFTRKY